MTLAYCLIQSISLSDQWPITQPSNSARLKLVQYPEKRGHLRNALKVPVMVEDLEDGFVYRARMVNYSKSGMYLETDVVLDLGAEILIGIEDSPYSISSSAVSSKASQYFRAEIRWQRELKNDLFNFGYGVHILFVGKEPDLPARKIQLRQEMRKHARKSYLKPVFFASENQYYKGLIHDISRGGVFISTQDTFLIGQIIRLVIPGTKIDKGVMLKGEVVRFDNTGVGLKFMKVLRRKKK